MAVIHKWFRSGSAFVIHDWSRVGRPMPAARAAGMVALAVDHTMWHRHIALRGGEQRAGRCRRVLSRTLCVLSGVDGTVAIHTAQWGNSPPCSIPNTRPCVPHCNGNPCRFRRTWRNLQPILGLPPTFKHVVDRFNHALTPWCLSTVLAHCAQSRTLRAPSSVGQDVLGVGLHAYFHVA
jgi:hypothetical protein